MMKHIQDQLKRGREVKNMIILGIIKKEETDRATTEIDERLFI